MTALRWRPDGREILAVQLDFQSAVPTVSLVAVDYPSGEIRTLFGPSVGVLGAAFGPDGKEFAIWSVRGLEIVREDTLQRTLVLPLSRLGGRELGIQGLQWSAADNLIALVLRAPVTGQSQLWVVRPDGTDPREIYPAPNGQQLLLGSFIAGPWSAARPYPGS
jgi:WD40 repeat protein